MKNHNCFDLNEFLDYVEIEDTYSMKDNLYPITPNTGGESLELLDMFKTHTDIISYNCKKAQLLLEYPDCIRISRCPNTTLVCKGGLLIAQEVDDEEGFTPFRLILFYKIAFTGLFFRQKGLLMKQWNGFSWGIPQEKDIVELDSYNIPGVLDKANQKKHELAKAIIEWIKEVVEKNKEKGR